MVKVWVVGNMQIELFYYLFIDKDNHIGTILPGHASSSISWYQG
jgi:hypothetical protein